MRLFRYPRLSMAVVIAALLVPLSLPAAQTENAPERELPPALAPLEFLIGKWKGRAVPRDDPGQRFRGWNETHTWAWVFSKGRPVGMSVAIESGKVLGTGTLRHDQARKLYILEGREPGQAGEPLVFTGTLAASGKLLSLERPDKGGSQRLVIRANSNYVRYTMTVARKEPGAVAFTPWLEVGLTKEGESFAAGGAEVERPTCIVTGGAATMTVSYQGQSYPICCTGCRDEFNENPQKYLAKLARKASGGDPDRKGSQPKPARVSKFEDAFAGDGDDARPAVAMPARKPDEPKAGTEPPPAGKSKVKAPEKSTARAATALRVAQNLEKSGKTATALKSYKQIVKDHPGTAEARTAAERIKALEAR